MVYASRSGWCNPSCVVGVENINGRRINRDPFDGEASLVKSPSIF